MPQYHHFIEAVPKKLEPGNPNYEFAAAAAAITPYLGLGQHAAPGVEGSEALDAAFEAIVHEGCWRSAPRLSARLDADIVGGSDGLAADRLPIISFRLAGWDAGVVAQAVEAAQVAVAMHHARRLIEHLGLAEGGVVRVSFAHYNTLEEVDRPIQALGADAAEGRLMKKEPSDGQPLKHSAASSWPRPEPKSKKSTAKPDRPA